MLTIEEIDALIADRARYRAVVRKLVRWDAPPAGQDATYHLVARGCEALANESKPAAAQTSLTEQS